MDQLSTQIILKLEVRAELISANGLFCLCSSARSPSHVERALERLVKAGQVEGVPRPPDPYGYRLISTRFTGEPVLDRRFSHAGGGLHRFSPDAKKLLDSMLAENQPTVDQYAFLMRSIDDSQQLLDEYLASVTDLGILESLEGMRNLARIQLEQFLNPENDDDLTSGVQRCGTG